MDTDSDGPRFGRRFVNYHAEYKLEFAILGNYYIDDFYNNAK